MCVLRKKDLIGHDVFELMRGSFENLHWLEDSLYITEDVFQKLELDVLFRTCLDEFSYFGVTVVTRTDWDRIKNTANHSFPCCSKVLAKIDQWARVGFQTEECFTVCGI